MIPNIIKIILILIIYIVTMYIIPSVPIKKHRNNNGGCDIDVYDNYGSDSDGYKSPDDHWLDRDSRL